MKISIIIPVYIKTDKSFIKLCTESIRRTSTEHHQVIVCVNPGDKETWNEYVHLGQQGLVDDLIVNSEQGQWKANNEMMKLVKHEWVLLMDDDTVLPPYWEDIFNIDLESDLICMNCMEPDWTGRGIAPPFVKHDCGTKPENFDLAKFEKASQTLREDKMEQGYSYPFLFKKSLWERIRGWDERYDPWGSNGDSDFEYQVVLSGVTPMRYRGVLAYHFAMQSGTFTLPEADPFLARNRTEFERKWGIVRVGSPDIWYAKLNLPNPNLRFKPDWADPKYL